jgi:hypothetical protein
VATEEESIKDLRTLAEANRAKDAARIAAEAEAQSSLVKTVKAAEASEEVAKHKARERMVTADAELETADKTARAKVRLAEGTVAQASAEGLGAVRVKEADAVATERVGMAEAKVLLEKMRAEATGLAQKAEAMRSLDEVSRSHEEFRLTLDKERVVELERLRLRKDMAEAQARVMGEALGHAKIQIVGGDGQFFDRFVRAVSLGQSVDGAIDQSETLRALIGEYVDGGRSLPADVIQALSRKAPTDIKAVNKPA